MMILAEDILTLVTTDAGTLDGQHQLAMSAALVTDLVTSGALTLSNEPRAKVTLNPQAPNQQHPVLVSSVDEITEHRNKRLANLISARWFDHTAQLRASLVERGMMERIEKKNLFFSTRRFPLVDLDYQHALKRHLAAVLRHNAAPEERSATILGLLVQTNDLSRLLRGHLDGMSRRAVRKEVNSLVKNASEDQIRTALKQVLAAQQAALTAAIATSASVAATT